VSSCADRISTRRLRIARQQAANRFDAADAGHRQVHDDDVGAHLGVALVGRFAAVRLVDDLRCRPSR
jgi:hypothetical protein